MPTGTLKSKSHYPILDGLRVVALCSFLKRRVERLQPMVILGMVIGTCLLK